jgi:hypothetical protein
MRSRPWAVSGSGGPKKRMGGAFLGRETGPFPRIDYPITCSGPGAGYPGPLGNLPVQCFNCAGNGVSGGSDGVLTLRATVAALTNSET